MADKHRIPAQVDSIFNISGHNIRVLTQPKDRLDAVLSVIGGAQRTVRMFSYMFHADQTGHEVLDALIGAAKRGVRVELMIDSFGSSETTNEFFAPLTKAGGQYWCFNSRWNLGYFVRNHQKILIADECHAVIGGFNITDHYFGRAGGESWQDFGVIISGDKVSVLAGYYDDLTNLGSSGAIHYRKLRKLIRDWSSQSGRIQWLIGGPTNHMSPWARTLKRDMSTAAQLDIVSAYFSPSQSVLRRISRVSRMGQSRLILAGKTDNQATIGAARSLYTYLLKRGARIFEFQSLPLHMKLVVIDNISYIGSSNLDMRSLFINMEIMLRIEDAALAERLRAIITDMAKHSELQTLKLHRNRAGGLRRMLWFGKYLLVNTVDYTVGRRIKFGLTNKIEKDA